MKTERVNQIKELLLKDFESIKNFYGVKEIEVPEFNIVDSFECNAKLELGSCKLLCTPIDWKTVAVNAMNTINIYVGRIKEFIKDFLKVTKISDYAKVLIHCVRYVGLHEIMHYIQLKSGVKINVDEENPSEVVTKNVESMCVDGLKDYIKQYHRNDDIMVNLLKIDEVNLEGIKNQTDVTEEIKDIASDLSSKLDV